MYAATVRNRNSPPAILLRQSYREGGQVKTRTLANLSKLPPEAISAVRALLKGQTPVSAERTFEVVTSPHHGHVQAVLAAMHRLRFAELIGSCASPKRNRVVALVAARVGTPQQAGHHPLVARRALPEILGTADADKEDLYEAIDWLLARQGHIERKHAARHLASGALALYDLSSSYFEGVTCPLAAFGHNRDGKRANARPTTAC